MDAAPSEGIPGIVRAVESAYRPVRVTRATRSPGGDLMLYRVMVSYGRYDPARPDEYRRRVGEGARNLRMAQVALLELTVANLAGVEHVGVYEDTFLVRVWSRGQIQRMEAHESYADAARFRALVREARVLSPNAAPHG